MWLLLAVTVTRPVKLSDGAGLTCPLKERSSHTCSRFNGTKAAGEGKKTPFRSVISVLSYPKHPPVTPVQCEKTASCSCASGWDDVTVRQFGAAKWERAIDKLSLTEITVWKTFQFSNIDANIQYLKKLHTSTDTHFHQTLPDILYYIIVCDVSL